MPSVFAQAPKWCGRATIRATLTMMTMRPCNKHRTATVTAVRHVYSFSSSGGSVGPRGKKTRNRNRLEMSANVTVAACSETYITLKENHCTPSCAIPRSPAPHSNVLTTLQHATSALEAGRTSIFAKAHVLDVVPRRMKYGEMPSEVPREMIR